MTDREFFLKNVHTLLLELQQAKITADTAADEAKKTIHMLENTVGRAMEFLKAIYDNINQAEQTLNQAEHAMQATADAVNKTKDSLKAATDYLDPMGGVPAALIAAERATEQTADAVSKLEYTIRMAADAMLMLENAADDAKDEESER